MAEEATTTLTPPKPSNCYAYPRASYILTPEDWQTILQHLQDGYSMAGAARAVGATRQAIYDHCNRNPAFAQAVKECTHEGTDFFVDAMRSKALDPKHPSSFLANMAMLKGRDRATWGDHVDVTTRSTINIILSQPPSIEELKASDDRLITPGYVALPAASDGLDEGDLP